jgi:hypothetical protein
MFRLRRRNDGWWITGMDGGKPTVTEYKDNALVLPKEKREFWEVDPDFEIVPLAEDEVMARMGQPRLEGF